MCLVVYDLEGYQQVLRLHSALVLVVAGKPI